MLPKKQRLNRVDFNEYFKEGKRFNGRVSTVIYIKNKPFKASVVVGKKVAKKAVVRNRLRRLGYRQIEIWQKLNPVKGVLLVLIKPTIATLPRKQQALAIIDDLGLLLK